MTELSLPTDQFGTAHHLDDGRQCVHFERNLHYSIETVWAAITEAAHLSDWFPGLVLEPKLGGKFEIWFSGDCEGPAHVTGKVTTFNPPHELQMGSMKWELMRDGDGCRLIFTDILYFDGGEPDEVTHSVLGGWHKYLDSLERHLHGGVGDPRQDEEVDYSKL